VLGQNQNPRREWRREAPPFSSWVLLIHLAIAIYDDSPKKVAKQIKSALRAANRLLGLELA
jgi:hypothetical protein